MYIKRFTVEVARGRVDAPVPVAVHRFAAAAVACFGVTYRILDEVPTSRHVVAETGRALCLVAGRLPETEDMMQP